MVEHADHTLPSAPVLMTWRQEHFRFQASQSDTVKTLAQKQSHHIRLNLTGNSPAGSWVAVLLK